jgi:hypothetical protein
MSPAVPIIRVRGLARVAAVFDHWRLVREQRTMDAMIAHYCQSHHARHEPWCPECAALREYTVQRLARCHFGAAKPTCVNCPIHCYSPQRREQVREVMRFAGPRMLLRHPILAVMHLLDGYRRPA